MSRDDERYLFLFYLQMSNRHKVNKAVLCQLKVAAQVNHGMSDPVGRM